MLCLSLFRKKDRRFSFKDVKSDGENFKPEHLEEDQTIRTVNIDILKKIEFDDLNILRNMLPALKDSTSTEENIESIRASNISEESVYGKLYQIVINPFSKISNHIL